MVRSLFDSCSIEWKEHSINWKDLSTDQNSKTEFSAEFFWGLFGKVEEVLSLVNGFMKHFNSPYVPFNEI